MGVIVSAGADDTPTVANATRAAANERSPRRKGLLMILLPVSLYTHQTWHLPPLRSTPRGQCAPYAWTIPEARMLELGIPSPTNYPDPTIFTGPKT
jgi:hypothetical protein